MTLTVACTGGPGFEALVMSAVRTAIPDAVLLPRGGDSIPRDLAAGAVVLDGRDDLPTATDRVRHARAGGYPGALVVVARNAGGEFSDTLSSLGAQVVAEHELAPGLAYVIAERAPDDAARESIARTRRLLAAGEIALGLQHSLNNPLAGLLAEAQLLEMEPLPADQMQSVRRIIDLTRRLVTLVRGLDGIGMGKR